MNKRKIFTTLPPGTKVGDLIPVFSGVDNEVRVGTPNPECASCRKPFNAVRKRRKDVRIYIPASLLPIAFSFDICGRCLALYQKGGADRDGVLAAVEAYCDGEEIR